MARRSRRWGATPARAWLEGDVLHVTLAGFDGNLLVIGARDPSGFEVCAAGPDSCRFVRAQLNGDEVLLGGVKRIAAEPARVRFCWADSPLCNLYDSTGLPVGPFEFAIQ